MPVKGKIIIRGVPQTQNVLRKVSPTLAKEMNKQFTSLGRSIASDARAITPVRSGKSKAGIKVYLGGEKIKRSSARGKASDSRRRAAGKVVPPGGNRASERLAGFRVVQTGKGGAILEFANRWKTPRGQKMVEAVRRKYPQRPGRFMWNAADRSATRIDAASRQIRRDVEAKLQAMMDRN